LNKLIPKTAERYAVYIITAIAAIIFFIASSTRHALFQSGAWDLGIFDQAVYLISRGQEPISSLTGFHILGDHAAVILYPLALLYFIFPDVHWLLGGQAIALAIAAIPIYFLAIDARLNRTQALTIAAIYLLYPAVFNINLFDFHPEVIALPALCGAILFARRGQLARFVSCVLLILSCKAVLALTVVAMGIWLLIFDRDCYIPTSVQVGEPIQANRFETDQSPQQLDRSEHDQSIFDQDEHDEQNLSTHPEAGIDTQPESELGRNINNIDNNWQLRQRNRKLCGAIAITDGITWFIIATQLIIPMIGGENAEIGRHLSRYAYLGNSFTEIFTNLFTQPQLLLGQVFSLDTLGYLALLIAPVIWIISPRKLTPLIAAIPALAMNILSSDGAQRDLVHQYSLPILPFLILLVIHTWRDRLNKQASGQVNNQHLFHSPRNILLWSVLAFMILSRLSFFSSNYLDSLDTWQANNEAIAYIKSRDALLNAGNNNYSQEHPSVLTTNDIAPHLTHRRYIRLAITDPMPTDLDQYDYVLLSIKHPGWLSSPEFAADLVAQYQFQNQSERLEQLEQGRSPLTDTANKANHYVQVYSQKGVYLFERAK
jgi:uncharacterized membrane protein